MNARNPSEPTRNLRNRRSLSPEPIDLQAFPLIFRSRFGYTVKTFLLVESQPVRRSTSALGGHVAFEIGDKVIYPNHGLGIIERIETKTIMGTTCGFYQLRMANETTVFVPVDNVDGVGLRRAISDEEVERLFNLLGDGKIDSHQNWKGRFKDNSDRMRTGSIYDVVEVLKSLTFLSKSKSLSFREKRMLDRAKFLVVSEITEVLGEKTPEVEEKVEKALERCFVAKARNAARAKAAKATRPRRGRRRRRGSRGCTRRRPRRAARASLVADSIFRGTADRGGDRTLATAARAVAVRPHLRARRSCSGPLVTRPRRRALRRGRARRPARASRSPASASASSAPSTSRSGAAVYACNHSSNIDPPAVFLALRRAVSAPARPLQGRAAKAAGARLGVRRWPASCRSSARIRTRAGRRSIGRPRRFARAIRSSFFPRARAAGRGSCCRSRRAASSWRSRPRRRSCPSPSRAAATAMRKGSPLIWPATVTVDARCRRCRRPGLTFDDRDALVGPRPTARSTRGYASDTYARILRL